MTDALRYLSGFGGHFETEAVAGALPKGRNSPQRPAFGLYAEQFSGSSFTAPRHENRRSWLYRMRPTADHRPFAAYPGAPLFGAAGVGAAPGAQPAALEPAPVPDGLPISSTASSPCCRRGPRRTRGVAVHAYRATQAMDGRVLVDADGELLIVPQQGAVELRPNSAGSTSPRARSDGAARGQVPGPAAPGRGARLRLRELRRPVAPAGTRPDRIERPRQPARLPGAGRLVRGPRRADRGDPEEPRATVDHHASTIRRSTSSPGTAITRPIDTICRASTRSAR